MKERQSEVSSAGVFFSVSVFFAIVFDDGGEVIVDTCSPKEAADKTENGTELCHCETFNTDSGKKVQNGVAEEPTDDPTDKSTDEGGSDNRKKEEHKDCQTAS